MAPLNSPRSTPPTRPGTARPTSAPPSPGDRHRARLRAVVTAVAVVMMASAGYIAYRIVTGDGASAHRGNGRTGSSSPATPVTGPATPTRVATPTAGTSGVPVSAGVGWPCPGSIPTTTYAVPAAAPDSERPGLAGNLIWYADGSGMLVPVPPGWQMVRGGGASCFYDGSLPRMLSVGSVSAPKGSSPIGVLTTLEIAARGQPGYHMVRPINQAGLLRNQAEWEYTFHGPSGAMHTIVRDYLGTGRASLVQWTTTDDSWSENLPIFSLIATGFHAPG